MDSVMDSTAVTKGGGRKLALRRETVQDLNDPILTTQGWSLWTCADTDVPGQRPVSERTPEAEDR